MGVSEREDEPTGMMIKIIEVERVIVPCRGEVLIHCHSRDGEIRIEVEPFTNASDEVLQGYIQTVTREVAMIS